MRTKHIALIGMTLVFLLAGAAFAADDLLLPAGLKMADVYAPGIGESIGKIVLVQGDGVVMHADMAAGYRAVRELPLYKGDTIVTRPNGRIQLELTDESVLTVGFGTRMVLDESVYDRRKKSRFSFIRMTIGRVRFFVRKLVDLRRSDFRVKTSSAVIGVRGSDFVVAKLEPQAPTEVTAFENTQVEVFGLADPGRPPVLITDLEKTVIEEGGFPTDPVKVPPLEIENLKQDFVITPEAPEKDATPGLEGKPKPAGPKGLAGGLEALAQLGDMILIPENMLVNPEEIDVLPDIAGMADYYPDIVEWVKVNYPDVQDQILEAIDKNFSAAGMTTVIDSAIQDQIINLQPLPDFPAAP